MALHWASIIVHPLRTHTAGASHDQAPGLPPDTSLTDTTFGRKGVKEDSAADAVSPCKTREEVEAEAVEGRELYRKVSHLCQGCMRRFVFSVYILRRIIFHTHCSNEWGFSSIKVNFSCFLNTVEPLNEGLGPGILSSKSVLH